MFTFWQRHQRRKAESKKEDGISILQVGMGPLGMMVHDHICQRQGWNAFGPLYPHVIAAVDKDPALAGTMLLPSGTRVFRTIDEAIQETGRPDVAVVTTVSSFETISPLLEAIMRHRIPIVSSCEEMVYPWENFPTVSPRIDAAAKRAGVAVLGTGVNPGFLMDHLPIMLASVCPGVDAICVKRFQDASKRRVPFQTKIGAGLALSEFLAKVENGDIRHVGLTESMQMIAAHFQWPLLSSTDQVEPVIALQARSGDVPVEVGQVAGIRQVGKAWSSSGRLRIELIFQATVGEEESYDEIVISGGGSVLLRSRIDGGVNGDSATCAVLLNSIPRLLAARPGLRTMIDL